MGQINIVSRGDRVGLWIGNDRGVWGIEAVEHRGLLLVVYPPGTRLPEEGPPIPPCPPPHAPEDPAGPEDPEPVEFHHPHESCR